MLLAICLTPHWNALAYELGQHLDNLIRMALGVMHYMGKSVNPADANVQFARSEPFKGLSEAVSDLASARKPVVPGCVEQA
jgi:hypothetical protein